MDHLLTLPLSPIEIASAKVLAHGFVILVVTAFSLYVVIRGLLAVPIARSIPLFLCGVALCLYYSLAIGRQHAAGERAARVVGPDAKCRLDALRDFAEAILFREAGLSLVHLDYLAVGGLDAVFCTMAVLRFRRSAAAN